MAEELWDEGAQNERTHLAWQRTTLSALACSLVVARLLASSSIVAAGLVGLAATASTAVLAWLSRRRYAANNRALHGATRMGDARPHLAVASLVVFTGIGALLYLFIS